MRFIPNPKRGSLNSPVWIPGTDELAVSFMPQGGNLWEDHLYTLEADGLNFTRLPLPDDPDCKSTSQHFPRLLPDGRLGYIQTCFVSLNPARRLPEGDRTLMAHDLARGSTERLVPYYLPVNANYFDFAPDMHVGIVNDGRGLDERLHWLWPDRREQLDLPLDRAGAPRWSPDGRAIAAMGVPKGYGADGLASMDVPKTLYLLSPDGKQLSPLLGGLREVGPPDWSPDSRWLAVSLTFTADPVGVRRLWLIDTTTGTRHLLLAGEQLGAVGWSPDGRSLAVAVGVSASYNSDYTGPVGLYILDLPDLDQLAG